MTWTTAVLAYQMTATSVLPTALQAAAQAVTLQQGEEDLIGFGVAGDVTTISGQVVTRTLTLELTGQFNDNVPAGANPILMFQNLYTMTLQQALVVPVTALPPLVT